MKINTYQILDALRQCGLDTDDTIIPDGQLHRIHILGDKRGTKNGWYIAYADGGKFGSWKEDVTHIWHSGEKQTLTQKRQMDKAYKANREKAELQRQERYALNLKHIRKAWDGSVPITDESASLARIYLKHRLHTELEKLPDNIRLHPSMYCKGSNHHPVMLAVISDPDGNPAGLHRTYLSETGKKADIPSAKKIMATHKDNAIRGGAIRLYQPEKTLIVAEGIETALSLHVMTGEPCWACISGSGLQNVIIPKSVENIIIGADHDEAGKKYASKLATRLTISGRDVKIWTPSKKGTDWNDFLVEEQAWK